MAPFPESEDMTVKRLMVALRKNDHQLLKMGTYKLHEKFHTGHEFELTDDLRQILKIVEEKQYPPEISDILCSTIKDILSKNALQKISRENEILPAGSGQNNLPQNLQKNEFQGVLTGNASTADAGLQNTAVQNAGAKDDIKELAQIINQNSISPSGNTILQNEGQIEIKPVQIQLNETNRTEEILPDHSHTNNFYRPQGSAIQQQVQPQQLQPQMQPVQNPVQNPAQNIYQAQPVQQTVQQPAQQTYTTAQPVRQSEPQKPVEQDNSVKNIAVFYDDFKNEIDFSKVKDYKNNLNLLFSKNENGQDYNILKQISSLTNALDTNTSDVDKIVSMLTTSKGKVSFISASQSQNISKIFVEKNIDFDIPFVKKAQDKSTGFDLIPMVGATNIFVCSNCNARTLKTDFNTRTLSVQCPHCDSAAFPDIYAVNSYNPDCNPVFWHRAFAALIKSQIWILVNPPLDENKEIIFDFIKTAYEASKPSRIYILSKENDKKEFYKQMFASVNENCVVKSNFQDQDKLCEEFINEEIIKKVFA